MPVPSILRNDKRFRKEVLDEASGEQLIFGGCADGIVKVYSRYTQMSTEDKKKVKRRRMTLFPTNRRIVAYAAGGFLTNDRYAQIPLDSLSKIVFQAWADKGRVQLVTDFVAPDDSEYRSISFMMPVPDLKQFEAFRAIIAGVSKTARVQIEDLTPRDARRRPRREAEADEQDAVPRERKGREGENRILKYIPSG